MTDLLADLYAEIDRWEIELREMEKTPGLGVDQVDRCTCYGGHAQYGHEPGCGLEPGPVWTLIQRDLRGLAEDRDILRRHAPPEAVPKHDPGPYSCVACSHAAGPLSSWVDWPCPDALSVFRRHGIEVPS